ncbi:MAG: sn-glycerol-1-phosphate dehydrogenase [Myxococcota bacterium]|nr:sn-glycerol-1-phosphate dehydrogenase [Myxococcota bacterium]
MVSVVQMLERLTRQAAQDESPHHTRHIALGSGVVSAVPAWLKQHRPNCVNLIVVDAETLTAAGERLLEALRSEGLEARVTVLDPAPGDDHLVCEDGAIEAMEALLKVSDRMNPIAVGAGTVNDIVKSATHRLGRPYQCVPTAASMNGYTSSIAAVLSEGVKRTLPAHQPEAVFADTDVIRRAPAVMNRAGFGDLLSKPYSHADWLLSHMVRGVDYSSEAAQLLDEPWWAMVRSADGIGRGEEDATRVLMETLLISGFSMALAGTSAPASGAEHLVSHYWDMEQHCQGLGVRALHGTQVGIGTRLSGLLLERLCELDAHQIVPALGAERRADLGWIDHIDPEHPHLTPEVMDEVKAQIRQKQRSGQDLQQELELVRDRWPEITERLKAALVPPEVITRALSEAGCASRGSDIGVQEDHLLRTLRVCRHIRTRYVGFDLMDDLGVLETWSESVVRETEDSADS